MSAKGVECEFSMVAGYKINIQNLIVCLYTYIAGSEIEIEKQCNL